jgi:hypothetical protein
MNERVEKLLKCTSSSTFTEVARGVLADARASLVGDPKLEEITTSHNDQRTIGIVRVSGSAKTNGGTKVWSSVVKIIDPNVDEGNAARWISIEIEQQVYEQNLFGSDDDLFRPAKSYLVETKADDIRVLWLEDLSGAIQPPWDFGSYQHAANHLGSFNGRHASSLNQLPFAVNNDLYIKRWGNMDFESRAVELEEQKHSKVVREAYQDTPIQSAAEFASLTNQIFDRARSATHGLAFGDSHARNMFPSESQTVGIDWAALGNDPVGVDIGVLIGLGMTFGVKEAQMVASAERDIYDSYASGLRDADWDGDMDQLRIGFFGQFAGYMGEISTVVTNMKGIAAGGSKTGSACRLMKFLVN